MPKTEIRYTDCLPALFEHMAKEGVLLASLDSQGKANVMTIGWGTVGVIWGRPVFSVLVRPSRYTYECIENTGDFTVNLQSAGARHAAELCGTVSGRDRDKLAELNWTTLPSASIATPIIAQCVLHYECRVIAKSDIHPDALAPAMVGNFYRKGDFHRVYYGEILRVTADEDFARA
jgi:flavin reductase (DIM6/NTAB) family NADH-FMN oxidoreductase RutF